MNKKIGFIGGGNMGSAMIGGIIGAGVFKPENLYVSALHEQGLKKIKEKYAVNVSTDNNVVAKECDIIVLSVKPNLYRIVIEEIKDKVKENVIIITIAPGQKLEAVKAMFGREIKIVRTMPNTPALVQEGMTAVCANNLVTEEELEFVENILKGYSRTERIEEYLMDAVVGVSGSSPAYVYMFIEALADGAVMQGMAREKAYTFAAQAVLGSAKMVLETGMHPGTLKDMVCSPGGTTIAAVAKLEEDGFRSAVINAVNVAAEKSAKM